MLWTPQSTNEELITAWDNGEPVFLVEMGGIGKGYEAAIQNLVIELVRNDLANFPDFDKLEAEGLGEEAVQQWLDWGVATIKRVDEEWHLSGAQVYAAKQAAGMYARNGYGVALQKAVDEGFSDRIKPFTKTSFADALKLHEQETGVDSADYGIVLS